MSVHDLGLPFWPESKSPLVSGCRKGNPTVQQNRCEPRPKAVWPLTSTSQCAAAEWSGMTSWLSSSPAQSREKSPENLQGPLRTFDCVGDHTSLERRESESQSRWMAMGHPPGHLARDSDFQ